MILEIEVFKVFVLVMVRFSGLIFTAPVLGSASFPAMGKIGLSALCAAIVTPTVPALSETLPDGMIEFSLLAIGELVIGMILGFLLTVVFAAIQVAGQIVDMLTGFGLINVFNPALETQVPVFGFFFFLIAVLYLLAIGGHRIMILALSATFKEIPLGGLILHPELLREITSIGTSMFTYGLLIAAPVAGAMLLAYLTMGILGRLVPQIQLFVVGFPITIGAGLLMVAFVMGIYLDVLGGILHRTFGDMSRLVRVMG
jgi:flagellar biosynthetic protein FliR